MYNYSPIKKLYIKNFRNIGEVEIDFSQSPIITLVGENEAGKTSVIKAFATCALHANPREQKDYIRDTTQMFGVAIDLEDSTRIVRIKEASGINSYQIIRPDGTKWVTNKITDGLPEEVAKIMGLIEEPETGEFLHIRTYEDKLLFVVTPNSTNYKVMYNALKVEQLTKAIKIGSLESNQLKSNINKNELSMTTLRDQMKDIVIIDTEPLINIRKNLTTKLQLLDKLETIKKLVDKIDGCERQLGALGLIDRFNLQTVDEVISSKLYSIGKLLNNKNRLENYSSIISDINNIGMIDTGLLDRISNVITKRDILNNKIKNAGALVHINEISGISEVSVVHMEKAYALINRLNTLKDQLNVINTTECNEVQQSSLENINKLQRIDALVSNINAKESELKQYNSYIESIQVYLKQCGVAVESCPRCGEAVIFDIDKIQ